MLTLKVNQAKVVDESVTVLKSGGLVIFPTETCYGAGVDATNQEAVEKLLTYKARREGRPLSIAVTDKNMASKYVKLNTSAINLYDKFLPGPLTVVSAGRHKVAKGVESETGTLGIRIPDYPLVIEIIKNLGHPITATSANVSYKPRPYSIPQLLKNTSKKQQSLIDLIIDAGTLPQRPTSTIVDTTLDDPLLIRQGGINIDSATTIITNSPEETKKLAQSLCLKYWKDLQIKSLVFLLIGDLGAGKTQFAKGIGEFLQIKSVIASPTYTIEKEYDYNRHGVKGKFLHLDTWRMQHLEELELLNLGKRLKPKTIVAIEWAGKVLNPLQKMAEKAGAKIITLRLETAAQNQPSHRRITFGR